MRKPPAELRRFLQAYDPSIAQLFFAARAAILGLAPNADELLYDAYNAVAAAYTFSNRLKESFCHIAAYRDYVNLGFNRGATLPDPEGLLAGSGRSIRHVRIATIADLKRPGVRRLLRTAVDEGRGLIGPLPSTGRYVVLGNYPSKRRPSREGVAATKKMTIAAKAWHRDHRLPARASLEQRVAWHLEHAKQCGCRPMPASVVAAIGTRAPAKRKSSTRTSR
jgi:hypothetical protein